jgi:hypothetical protein
MRIIKAIKIVADLRDIELPQPAWYLSFL